MALDQELEDGEIPSDRDSAKLFEGTDKEENEIDKIIDEVRRSRSPRDTSTIVILSKPENVSKSQRRSSSKNHSRRRSKPRRKRSESRERRDSLSVRGHVVSKSEAGRTRNQYTDSSPHKHNGSSNVISHNPPFPFVLQMPSTSFGQCYAPSFDPIPPLPPPPPPPPFPLQSHFVSNNVDNYDSSDMDIDESDRTPEESDKVDDDYLNVMRKQLLETQAARSENNLLQDIRRQERIIQSNEHLLAKRKAECKELVQKYIQNKKMRLEYKSIIRNAIEEKESLEIKLKNIRFSALNKDADVPQDSQEACKELDDLAIRMTFDDISEMSDSASTGETQNASFTESGESKNVDSGEVESPEKKDVLNISCELSEEEMRRKLLETFKKRAESEQPQEQEKKENEDESIQKGKEMFVSMCRFDMNGTCSRGKSCMYMHLDDARFDEKMFLASLFREIYRYNKNDIDGAVNQLMARRAALGESTSSFIKTFLSRTMSIDEVVRNRFYTFSKKGFEN